MARAAARARQERNDVIASMTAHLMNVSGKRVRKHVTPDDLLGRPTVARSAASAEFKRAAAEERGD